MRPLKTTWQVLAILAFAFTLRLVFFTGILEGDDADYIKAAQVIRVSGLEGLSESSLDASIVDRIGVTLPIALSFRLFGANEYSAILFPLLASLITCVFIYKIAYLYGGQKAGVMAALLWAVFPLDIFLATQTDPEGILAMTTTVGMFFLLAAPEKDELWEKTLYFSGAMLFFVWAIKVKPSVMPILFMVPIWIVWRHAPSIKRLITRLPRASKSIRGGTLLLGIILLGLVASYVFSLQPWPVVINSTELSANDVSAAWILGRLNPVSQLDLDGAGYWSVDRLVLETDPRGNMLTTLPRNLQFNNIDAFTPLFLISLAFIILKSKKKYNFLLVWFAFLFLYLEWGIFPRQIAFPGILLYLPIPYYLYADNFLYICVPFVLVASVFVAETIEEKSLATLSWVFMIAVLIVSLALQVPLKQNVGVNLSSWVLALISYAILFILLLHGNGDNGSKIKGIASSLLMVAIGIGSLYPSPEFSLASLAWARERRDNLRAAIVFMDGEPELPILNRGPLGWLQIYAGDKYDERITDDVAELEDSEYFSLNEGCDEPISDFNQWPLVEIGTIGLDNCISLYKSMPAVMAKSKLQAVELDNIKEPSQEFLQNYLNLAANAQDMQAFIKGLSLLVTHYPNQEILQQASTLIEAKAEMVPMGERDLLQSYQDENGEEWQFGKFLNPTISALGDGVVLQVTIEKSTDLDQEISLPLKLKSSTAYVLTIELRSFAPFDLVRFPDQQIPDSYEDGWGRSTSWETYQVVFVTPEFKNDEEEVQMELARVYDRGDIQFRQIILQELYPND